MSKNVSRLFAGFSGAAMLAMLTTAGVVGCGGRAHLTERHGQSFRSAFAQQQANPQAGNKAKPLPGLDSQESAAISRNYRRSLVTKDSQSSDQGMLILGAPQQAQPNMPPPSVPQERQ